MTQDTPFNLSLSILPGPQCPSQPFDLDAIDPNHSHSPRYTMANLASVEPEVDDWIDLGNPEDVSVFAKLTLDVDLYRRMNAVANQRLKDYSSIFVTDQDPRKLYALFHDALPGHMKPQYSCNSCRGFVRRYGGLVMVDQAGSIKPLFWDPADSQTNKLFHPSISAVARQLEGSKVTREWKITEAIRLKMQSYCARGGFNHMYLSMPGERISKGVFKGFARASTTELAKMLAAVIKAYRLDTIRRVAHILEQVQLPHADNHKAASRWLLDLLENDKIKRHGRSDSVARHNLGYRYAASAFPGCIGQLKNGVLSRLLDAVETNQPWDAIEKQWKELTEPTKYLRPQAAPKAGNIAVSERLFHELGITEKDLLRRFAVFQDIPENCIMWESQHTDRSTANKAATSLKLFASVKPKASTPNPSCTSEQGFPTSPITFTKLLTTILPTAKRLEYKLSTHDGLYFFITGYPDTKPLMHWHFDDNENRASWYIYQHPYPVQRHGLMKDQWHDVKAVVPFPHLWDGVPVTTTLPVPKQPRMAGDEKDADTTGKGKEGLKWYHLKQGFRYLLCLANIYDKNDSRLSLFPALLKGEFHGARATIEAYSNEGSKNIVENAESKGGYIGGIGIERDMGKRGDGDKHLVRVTDQRGLRSIYELVLFE